jgi:glucan 1,3-beta-glucosidase
MHGAPGSQNGWNHSGQSGTAKWLNGPDGERWGQRALDVHNQLSQFFAQPRYKNVVTMYGLVNEPMMLKLEIEPVLEWTTKAAELVSKNGIRQHIVFGDGFLLLSRWKTMLQDTGHNFVLDTHQYTIFNNDLVRLKHQEKLEFVCKDWVKLIKDSNTKGTG